MYGFLITQKRQNTNYSSLKYLPNLAKPNLLGCLSLKGGDPAPPSGRATLLRLHPSHQPHLGRLSPFQVESTT